METACLTALYRYPVKGLSPEPLDHATLEAGGWFPGDRIHAVENGPSGFDPAKPVHRPKIAYLMLMRQARLARLHTHYDDATTTLVLNRDGKELARGNLSTPEGRAAIEDFLSGFMGMEARGPLKVLNAPASYRFMDSAKSGFVSLLNLATVRDLETQMGTRIDPLRFRMNLHLEGWPAGAELELVGRTLMVGPVRFEVLKRTSRCPATEVNPRTAERDLDVVAGLRRAYGHVDCGIYMRPLNGGTVRMGDRIELCAPVPEQASSTALAG